jgi:cbb3-type cytochrome oxidase maturation protein
MIDFFFLVPIAIGLGLAGLASFMWTLKNGQYDDLEGAAQRILFDRSDGPEFLDCARSQETAGNDLVDDVDRRGPPRSNRHLQELGRSCVQPSSSRFGSRPATPPIIT